MGGRCSSLMVVFVFVFCVSHVSRRKPVAGVDDGDTHHNSVLQHRDRNADGGQPIGGPMRG